MLVNICILPFSPLQKHRNFQYLPYKIKSKVTVSYCDVLFQHSLLVLAVPGWCCEVRRSVVCCLLLCSICVAVLSGVFLGKSSIKMLVGSQKIKATDNMANISGFFPLVFHLCMFLFSFSLSLERWSRDHISLCFTSRKALYHYSGSYWRWHQQSKCWVMVAKDPSVAKAYRSSLIWIWSLTFSSPCNWWPSMV